MLRRGKASRSDERAREMCRVAVITIKNGDVIRKEHMSYAAARRHCLSSNWRDGECQLAIQITGGERNEKKDHH